MIFEKVPIIIKPDIIQSRNIGNVLAFISNSNAYIISAKLSTLTKKQIVQIYGDHKQTSYYDRLEDVLSKYPSLIIVVVGFNLIERLSNLKFFIRNYYSNGAVDINNGIHIPSSKKEASSNIEVLSAHIEEFTSHLSFMEHDAFLKSERTKKR